MNHTPQYAYKIKMISQLKNLMYIYNRCCVQEHCLCPKILTQLELITQFPNLNRQLRYNDKLFLIKT